VTTVQHGQSAALSPRRALRLPVLTVIVIVAVSLLKLGLDLLVVPGIKGSMAGLWSIGHADNYANLAKNLDAGYGYRFRPDTAPTLMREPGYPYIISLLVGQFDNYNIAAVVLNVLLSMLAALLISHLTRFVTPIEGAAMVAPLLYMLHPGVMIAELRIGVEIPFILLLLCFFALLRRALRSGTSLDYCVVGLALGVTCYIRSTALLFPPLLLAYSVWTERSWRALAQMTLRVVLIIGVALAVLSPWIVRNYRLTGSFVPTASVQGVAMQVGYYICTHEDGRKSFHDLDDDAAEERNEIARRAGYRFVSGYYQFFYDPRDEVRFNSQLNHAVIQQYLRSPGTFAQCAAENVFNFWFTGKNLKATAMNMCVQLPYIVLAVLGLGRALRTADRALLGPFVLFIFYSVAVYAVIHGQARYSVPLVPILSILAAIPLLNWRHPAGQPAAIGGASERG
jgi:Dolichyl-phosphate-mannose-protein mannosyltransferase